MSPARKHYEELIARNERSDREAQSDTMRDLARTAVHVLLWILASMVLLGLGLHSRNPDLAAVFWLAGQTLWIAAVSFSILGAYRRGVVRGDWT